MSIAEENLYTSLNLLEVCFLEQCWRVAVMPSDLYHQLEHALPLHTAQELYALKRELLFFASPEEFSSFIIARIKTMREYKSLIFQDPASVAEFAEKLETLIDFSERNKDIFKLVWIGDEFGGGVQLLRLPASDSGYFTEIRFHWSRPLVYEVEALNAFFENNYADSQHPIARRLWDRGHSLCEKEVFIGMPGFFNHACSGCVTMTVTIERDDIDCSVGGYFFIYFQSWVHNLVLDQESFDLTRNNLMATWEYHYRQTELVFHRCSICKKPLTLAGIADKQSVRDAFKHALEIFHFNFFDKTTTIYAEELKRVAENFQSYGFGLEKKSTNVDLICKCSLGPAGPRVSPGKIQLHSWFHIGAGGTPELILRFIARLAR